MPKKSPKNAFFYFMMDFKEEQKEKGINYANMREVQQAADPVWRSCPSTRSKYENKAKQEKARRNIPDQKFTSTGIPYSQIEFQERQVKEAAETELKDIQNFVRQNTINKKILDEYIFIIDVNALCVTSYGGYVFGEVSVLRFNIRDGIKDHIHEVINPPTIPLGYSSDVKSGCEEFGLDFPDSSGPKADYMQILAQLVVYLKESDPSSKVLPPLYTLPEKEDQVINFISQLCHISSEEEHIFRVYKLDLLLFNVVNSLKNCNSDGLPRESLALAALKKDTFRYTPRIGCEHHEAGERSVECTLSRARRWTFTFLDSCLPGAGVQPVPGRHIPEDVDIDAVLTFKEKKLEEWRQPGSRAPSSCTSRETSLYDSFEAPACSGASSFVKLPPSTRSMKPLRKPTVDTLKFQSSIVVAPELSVSDFPPLNLGSGRGSGRNLANDMKNLNLRK